MKKTIIMVFLSILLVSSVSATITDSLTYLTLDNSETTGTTAIDSKYDYNGTLVNGIISNSSGVVDEGYEFDGVNDYLDSNIPVNYYQDTDNFSVCVWANWSQNTADQDGIIGCLDGSNNGFAIELDSDNTIKIFTGEWHDSNKVVALNTYHHICFVNSWQGANSNVTMYINGTEELTYIDTFSDCTANLVYGAIYNYAAYRTHAIDGTLDEAAFFNRALSDSEVLDLFNNNKNGNQYPFGQQIINIIQPSNNTYIFNPAYNVTITTSLNGVCKYGTNSTFNFLTEGTAMTGTSTTHWFIVNATTELKNFSYYYKCNQSNGSVTSTGLHFFKGKDKDWNNTILGISDSILRDYSPDVNYSNWATKQTANYFRDVYGWYNMLDDNEAIGGSCLSDYGSCATHDPMEDRYVTDLINRNARYAYLMPNINDNTYDVPVQYYKSAYKKIVEATLANATNTTLITSTTHSHIYSASYNYDEPTYGLYNAAIREIAILNEIPLFEWTYIQNHNSSNLYGFAHMNLAGHTLLNKTLVDVIKNIDDYKMTINNFNIYHDCNNAITVLNYTLISPTMNCNANTDADWLILKNLSNNNGNFTIERADKPFVLNISSIFNANTNYTIAIWNTSWVNSTKMSTASGDIQNLQFDAGKKYVYIFETTTTTNCTPSWSCTGYGVCNESGLAPCNSVLDLNYCGQAYTGNYSEFTPQACSSFTYDEQDIPKATISTLVKFFIVFSSFVAVIAILVALLWLKILIK